MKEDLAVECLFCGGTVNLAISKRDTDGVDLNGKCARCERGVQLYQSWASARSAKSALLDEVETMVKANDPATPHFIRLEGRLYERVEDGWSEIVDVEPDDWAVCLVTDATSLDEVAAHDSTDPDDLTVDPDGV